jgi:hypothetical protein
MRRLGLPLPLRSQPFYLVHAPGRLHQPDLIDPCEPTAAACTPPGAFYALGWTSEDVLGGYRSACHLRLDRSKEQLKLEPREPIGLSLVVNLAGLATATGRVAA